MKTTFEITIKHALEWYVECGVTETIGTQPINRCDLKTNSDITTEHSVSAPAPAPVSVSTPTPTPTAPPPATCQNDALFPVDSVNDMTNNTGSRAIIAAEADANNAHSLSDLKNALHAYSHCQLKIGARTLVFSDGNPQARIMLVGEAPGRDEDIQGKPFVGRSGQLLDTMFRHIGFDRHSKSADTALYITNVVPWRPPENRNPTADEIAMMLPFVRRHIKLINPTLLVAIGNIACNALLGKTGITKLRGKWTNAVGYPTLPMFHPAYLLRNPLAKRQAWYDLLTLQSTIKQSEAQYSVLVNATP